MPQLFDQYLSTTSGIFSISEIATVQEGLNILPYMPTDEVFNLKAEYQEEPVEGLIIKTTMGSSMVVTANTLVQTPDGWIPARRLHSGQNVSIFQSQNYPDADFLDLRSYNTEFAAMPKPVYFDEGMANSYGHAYGMVSTLGVVDPKDSPSINLVSLQGFPDGSTPDNCFMPWEIYRSPQAIILSFLKGLYKVSGMADSESILLNLKSDILASEVQFFLSHLGILSSVFRGDFGTTVCINTIKSGELFRNLIGLQDPIKDSFLEAFLDNYSEEYTHTQVFSVEPVSLNCYKIPEVKHLYIGPFCIVPR